MPEIGPHFIDELHAKETETGLRLAVPGVSWGDPAHGGGLDPLPKELSVREIAAIQEVVAAHDPHKPAQPTKKELFRLKTDVVIGDITIPAAIREAFRALKEIL